jgi:hypothetical protein
MANTSQSVPIGPDVPAGYTALYDDKGFPYLVPNFIMPAAQVKASAEYNKETEHTQAPHGVGQPRLFL